MCFVFAAVTIFGAVALHVAWLLVPPPSRLPDLYPSLIALYCGKSQEKIGGRCRPALTSVWRAAGALYGLAFLRTIREQWRATQYWRLLSSTMDESKEA